MAWQGLKFVSEMCDLAVGWVVTHQRPAYVKAGGSFPFLLTGKLGGQ